MAREKNGFSWIHFITVVLMGTLLVYGAGWCEEKAVETAEEEEIPEIFMGQKMADDHQEVESGAGCMECHRIKVDAESTATHRFLQQKGALKNDDIWKEIVAFFGHRTSCVLATNINNESYVTTIDFAVDPVNRVFYALSEKGTRKLNQMRTNPNVALEYHKTQEWEKNTFRCLQMRGAARVFSADDPQFEQGLKVFNPDKVPHDVIKRGMDMTCFTPQEILFYDVLRRDKGSNIFQLWKR